MPINRLIPIVLLLWGGLMSSPAAAQQYEARRNGDIVQLEDKKNEIVVSIVTSVGNMAYEMKVKGHEVLRFPFASIADFKAKPTGLHGIPFMGPWANRLDEQAFYANGKRYAFDMQLGNVTGQIPIHGFMSRTDQWQVVEARHDANAAWVTSRLDTSAQAAWMKQWPFAHTIDMTYRLQNGTLEVLTKITNNAPEPMPVSIGYHPYLSADRFTARRVDGHRPRTDALAAAVPESAHRSDRVDREVLSGRQGHTQGLQPGRCLQRPRA